MLFTGAHEIHSLVDLKHGREVFCQIASSAYAAACSARSPVAYSEIKEKGCSWHSTLL